jgi:four helix bundle protein
VDFEKLLVWQRSKNLAVVMYQAFADCRDFGFRSHITRAAVSVPSNIAEGMERRGPREKTWFLSVANAQSCGLN